MMLIYLFIYFILRKVKYTLYSKYIRITHVYNHKHFAIFSSTTAFLLPLCWRIVIVFNTPQYASQEKDIFLDNYGAIITPNINNDSLTASTVLTSFQLYPTGRI